MKLLLLVLFYTCSWGVIDPSYFQINHTTSTLKIKHPVLFCTHYLTMQVLHTIYLGVGLNMQHLLSYLISFEAENKPRNYLKIVVHAHDVKSRSRVEIPAATVWLAPQSQCAGRFRRRLATNLPRAPDGLRTRGVVGLFESVSELQAAD